VYIRTSKRNNKDGSQTEYVQLAHNEWDKSARRSTVKVLLNFGRKEAVDLQGLERLVASIQKFLGSSSNHGQSASSGEVKVLASKAYGGSWLIDQLWQRLQIGDCLKRLLKKTDYEIPIERALLAMVANRAVDPSSKLSTEHWVNNEAYIPGLPCVSVHQLYRSMDFLLEHDEAIQENVFFSVASLLNLEVDLIYFDTTTAYFEIDDPDEVTEEEDDNVNALRKYGHNKDHRPDLPQIVIGMAVTKEGIPVRCWVFSGETSDTSLVEQVKKDLNGCRLWRVICVMDRGFSSEENCIKLQSGGGHYIIGEKMRSGKPEVEAALSKRGRYTQIREGLFAKEAIIGNGERRKRFAVVLNQKEAARDRHTRDRHLKTIAGKLAALTGLKKRKEHTKAVCALISHPVYGRYLKTLADGTLAINKQKIATEERLDGKYIIKTSDDTLSLSDMVLGYKQLQDIEHGFKTLKSELGLRPMYHRKSDRIRAHVLICWLALLVVRIAENETGMSWFAIRRLVSQICLVTLQLPEGIVHQSSELSSEMENIFHSCQLKPPQKFIQIQPS
jgi:transposase